MKNELLTIGPITFHGYGLMIAIAILAAFLTAEYRAKKKGLNHELIFNLTIWCAIGGIIGAKLLYIITQLNDIIADPKNLIISEGFVVYGGIIGGILTGFFFCKKHKLNFLKYFDLVMPSIALAQGFGRIGCLLAGCCYGTETKSAFSIVFHDSDVGINNVRLVPTQPISSALDFLNFFALIFLSKKIKTDGLIAGFYLVFYSIGRFFLEFFRGDLERGSVVGISTSQFISIFLFVIGLAIIVIMSLRAKKTAEKDE